MNRAGVQLLTRSQTVTSIQAAASIMSMKKISRRELLEFDTFLFDADGVLWTGDHPVPGAVKFMSDLQAAGKTIFIITNNSTKTIEQYLAKVQKHGYSVTKDNILSPAIVLTDYLRNNPEYTNEYVYLIGTENLKKSIESGSSVKCFGLGPDSITDHSDNDFCYHVDMSIVPKAVICSYDSHFSYPKIQKAANFLARKGTEFLVTNEDVTFPGPDPNVIVPGSGVTSAAIRAVSGMTPTVFGKPHKAMAAFLMDRCCMDPTKTMMFGDRLDTDIAFANVNGFHSCWMSTGVHTEKDIENARSVGHTHLLPEFTYNFLNEE